ncbi:hypothetical protein CC80DRAFT_272131 [Byssothecium circinans]|uniref:Uncharacterized protein n=1 Tax=Byssothecium circinans TaxID=147558 RepID=A0A6A5TBA0_9PLEO|nr:hypothetical protein CC80DRAFT_272131 [Byssothecium circinans]
MLWIIHAVNRIYCKPAGPSFDETTISQALDNLELHSSNTAEKVTVANPPPVFQKQPKRDATGDLFPKYAIRKWFSGSSHEKVRVNADSSCEVKSIVAAKDKPPYKVASIHTSTALPMKFEALYGRLGQVRPRIEPFTFFSDVDTQDVRVQALVDKLNGITANSSPLTCIQTYLQALISQDFDIISYAFEHIRKTVSSAAAKSTESPITIALHSTYGHDAKHVEACQKPWWSCEVLTTCIIALAVPAKSFSTFAKYQTWGLGGHFVPDMGTRFVPSASLKQAFQRAKALALGPGKSTSLLHVSLVDVTYADIADHGKDSGIDHKQFFNFNHWFVLGVGPEGTIIWSSWRTYGPRLDAHIAPGGAKVRGWDEAIEFVTLFDDFARRSTSFEFTSVKNDQFRRLFGLDLLALTKDSTEQMKLTPIFAPWVGIEVIEDVKAEDVVKFKWAVDEVSPRCEKEGHFEVVVTWKRL